MAASTTARHPLVWWRPIAGALCVFLLALAAAGTVSTPAAGQTNFLTFPPRAPTPPSSVPKRPARGDQTQMLVNANEIRYDYANERVSAVGNVQIYYGDSTVEADRVIYDQRTKRLHAEGNVRLTEKNGRVTYGEILDLNDDYRDGFIDSLRLDTPDQTRFAAVRAERAKGNFTIFHSGVYTACEPCKDDPKKPPLWQVKAARIIHDENERMIYFEDARVELFGMPIAYFPYFSAPDPTVVRKSGFLAPSITSSKVYGVAMQAPYYWALAPDYDLTVTPTITTQQGPLLQAEWRQRLVNGAYMIRGSGIFQLDKDYFPVGSPANRDWRGSFESSGQFALSDKWLWGWDAFWLSDKTFLQDYRVSSNLSGDPTRGTPTEGVSQIYLTGKGDRSYFDIRAINYYGLSVYDRQAEIPTIHPVLDYHYVFGQPILGGELSYKVNLTSLSRDSASFEPITQSAVTNSLCTPTADPAITPGAKTPGNCLLRGIPGTYSRLSAEVDWRRTITDSFGQVWTPFASLRADAAQMSILNQPGVSNYIATGDYSEARMMPTIGLEYRYPFISAHSWGTQTIEPIAQIILRPNEPNIGKLPNEDSQSLVFDDSNLFKVDKYAGWDRIEGGGRVNAGLRYTAQFNQGGFVNVLFGQSYQIFGTNSFAAGDITNAGVNSGLETARSDYVARVSYQPDKIYTFTTRYRFDETTWNVRRFEAEAKANYDRWSLSLLYGNYDAQPELGFLSRRQGVLGSAAFKLTQNWVVQGALRYNIEAGKFDQTQIGAGYVDDCLILALNYITSYNYNFTPAITDHRVMLQMSLRTLGETSVSQTVNGLPGGL